MKIVYCLLAASVSLFAGACTRRLQDSRQDVTASISASLPEAENTQFRTEFLNLTLDFQKLDSQNYRERLFRFYDALPDLRDDQALARIRVVLDYGDQYPMDGLEPLLLSLSDLLSVRVGGALRTDLQALLLHRSPHFAVSDPNVLSLMTTPLSRVNSAVVVDVRADVARVLLTGQLSSAAGGDPRSQALDGLFGLASVQQAACLLPPLDPSRPSDLRAADAVRQARCQALSNQGLGGVLDSATGLSVSACLNVGGELAGAGPAQLAGSFAAANDCADQLQTPSRLHGDDRYSSAGDGLSTLVRLLGAEFGATAAKDLHDALRAGGEAALRAVEKYTDELIAERGDRIKGQTQAAKDYFAAIGAVAADEANIDLEIKAVVDAEQILSDREADVADAQTAVDNAQATLTGLQNALGGTMTDDQRAALNARIDSAKADLTDKQHTRDGDISERNKARDELRAANKSLKATEEKFNTDTHTALSAQQQYQQQGGNGGDLNAGGTGSGAGPGMGGGGGTGSPAGPELPDACTGLTQTTGPTLPGPGVTGTGIVGQLDAWSQRYKVANPNPETTDDVTSALALPYCGADGPTLRPAARACAATTCPDATRPCGCVSAETLAGQLQAASTLMAQAQQRACQDLRLCTAGQSAVAVAGGPLCACQPTNTPTPSPTPSPFAPAPSAALLQTLFLSPGTAAHPVVESNPLKFFVRQALLRY